MHKKNLIVGQSGGPTAVINSSLYGVVTEAYLHSDKIQNIYGMINGIEGFLNNNILNFDELQENGTLKYLKYTPGAYLGSCRFKLPDSLEDPIYAKIFNKFNEMNIGYFLYIGGNDSMDTVSKLSQYAHKIHSDIYFIGEPKTIDNDLIMTDHTPGYGSAAKYVATTVREIICDSYVYNQNSVTIIEIMGRHTGWLTASSALAKMKKDNHSLLIYLPEVNFSLTHFIQRVREELRGHKHITVCIAEGIHDNTGKFLCEHTSNTQIDNFGHKMLTGAGKYLENYIRSHLNIKVRSIELNVNQRCCAALMSATDQQEAIMAGRFGVQMILKKQTGKMIAFERDVLAEKYHIHYKLQDVTQICNKEKSFPVEWISSDETDVTNEFIEYVRPLIQGKIESPLDSSGLPDYILLT